jgi:exonuclease I
MDRENSKIELQVDGKNKLSVIKDDWIDTVKQKLMTVIEDEIRTLSIGDYKKLRNGIVGKDDKTKMTSLEEYESHLYSKFIIDLIDERYHLVFNYNDHTKGFEEEDEDENLLEGVRPEPDWSRKDIWMGF